jgi:hypothetical protein
MCTKLFLHFFLDDLHFLFTHWPQAIWCANTIHEKSFFIFCGFFLWFRPHRLLTGNVHYVRCTFPKVKKCLLISQYCAEAEIQLLRDNCMVKRIKDAINTHSNENPIYVFLFWELGGLSPNFHIHASVSDLYIPKIGLHISCSRIGRSIVGIYKSLTDT